MIRRVLVIILVWLAALLFALNTGRDLAFNLFYFVTGAILIALWWAWSNLRGLELRRVTRGLRTQVGKYLEETLELTNLSGWPKLWVEVRDYSDVPGHQVSRVVNSLRKHSSSRWQVRTLCRQRGRYFLGPVTVSSGDPLGIFRFSRELPRMTPLLVTPATIDISGFSPPTGYLAGGEVRQRRTPYVTTSVAGVRDYAVGDSFNRIHWPSTARTGRLISKEFELDPLADVWVFLDMYRDAQAESPETEPPTASQSLPWLRLHERKIELPASTVEYGVTIAASLAQHFIRLDRSVGFLSYAGQREMIHPDRGERQLDRLLEVLSVIQAEGRVPLAQVLSSEGARLGRHTMLVVVTPATDPEWVSALRSLRSRGIQGVAVLMAARTFGPALDWHPVLANLQAGGMAAYVVHHGDDLSNALSHPIGLPGPGRRFGGQRPASARST